MCIQQRHTNISNFISIYYFGRKFELYILNDYDDFKIFKILGCKINSYIQGRS